MSRFSKAGAVYTPISASRVARNTDSTLHKTRAFDWYVLEAPTMEEAGWSVDRMQRTNPDWTNFKIVSEINQGKFTEYIGIPHESEG